MHKVFLCKITDHEVLRISSLPDAAAENSLSSVAAESTSGVAANMTPDHDAPTDALVPDVTVTTGNMADDTHRSKGPSKQKSSHTQPNAKRSKSNADKEIDVNRCCAWVCMLMMLVLGGVAAVLMLKMDS